MTEKLYYSDPYLKSCTARILAVQETQQGLWLLPDKTLFYPGGGGQKADGGTINGEPLKQIQLRAEEIWHLTENKTKMQAGSQVHMELDWPQRFYRMQQHTGQHLLSHVLFRAGLATVSVHLGEEHTLIEVDGDPPPEEKLREIESRANALIRSALAVKIYWTDKEALGRFPLRREAGDHDVLRIVEIDGHDFSACAGTHLANTAQIGLIKWAGAEKIRKHRRLKYFIGRSAYAYFEQLHQMQNELKELLHNDFGRFADRVREMQQNLAAQKKELRLYRKAYLDFYAQRLARGQKPVVLRLPAAGADVQELARRIAGEHQLPALIFAEGNFALALPAESAADGRRFLREYGAHLGLKGGGAADYIRGRIEETDEQNIEQAFLRFLTGGNE